MAAHEVAALIRHAGVDLPEACDRVLREQVGPLGGGAGLIALGPTGDPAMPFTTEAMHRAWRTGDGPAAARYFTT